MTRAALRRIVTGAYRAWLNTLTAAGDMAAFDGMRDAWLTFAHDELADHLTDTYQAGQMTAWLGMPAPPPIDAAMRWEAVVNNNAVSYLRDATTRLSGVGDSLWRQVRSQVELAVQKGVPTEQLKAKLEDLTTWSEYRADTVARTETNAAYVQGDMAGARALGDQGPLEKVWVATRDARTRRAHAEADDQCVVMAAQFSVGAVSMDSPHEPGAPAGQVVNCRCYVELLYAGDTRPDGTIVTPHPTAVPAPVTITEQVPVAAGRLTTAQYEAMMPSSTWSEAKRNSILDALRADDNGSILADTLDRFQDGGSIARLRTNIAKRLAGEVVDQTSAARADAVVDALRHAPVDAAPTKLFRGMSVKGTESNLLAKYTPGDSLDLNLTSFTTDRAKAVKFQQMTAGKGTTRVMVELVGEDKRLLSIQNLARDRRLFAEREWVGGGRYEVLEAKKAPAGGIIVRIRQVAPL